MQVNSEFQAFKHVEILGPGEHMRAQQPLEATLAIHPTVVLTNALPYPMHLILWQVGKQFGLAGCVCSVRLSTIQFAITRVLWHVNAWQVAPLHKLQKRSSSLKRTVSSPARSGRSVEETAVAAAAAVTGSPDSSTTDGSPPQRTRRLQELASVLSGTMPMGPEDNLLLEELLKVSFQSAEASGNLQEQHCGCLWPDKACSASAALRSSSPVASHGKRSDRNAELAEIVSLCFDRRRAAATLRRRAWRRRPPPPRCWDPGGRARPWGGPAARAAHTCSSRCRLAARRCGLTNINSANPGISVHLRFAATHNNGSKDGTACHCRYCAAAIA